MSRTYRNKNFYWLERNIQWDWNYTSPGDGLLPESHEYRKRRAHELSDGKKRFNAPSSFRKALNRSHRCRNKQLLTQARIKNSWDEFVPVLNKKNAAWEWF